MNNNKIQKIFHYIIVLLLVILWSIMMFFPEHIDTMNFKIFFSISLACAMIYSFCRKKYFSMQTYCKTETKTAKTKTLIPIVLPPIPMHKLSKESAKPKRIASL